MLRLFQAVPGVLGVWITHHPRVPALRERVIIQLSPLALVRIEPIFAGPPIFFVMVHGHGQRSSTRKDKVHLNHVSILLLSPSTRAKVLIEPPARASEALFEDRPDLEVELIAVELIDIEADGGADHLPRNVPPGTRLPCWSAVEGLLS